MILEDDAPLPGHMELKGQVLFDDTPEEAGQKALEYLGMCAERN